MTTETPDHTLVDARTPWAACPTQGFRRWMKTDEHLEDSRNSQPAEVRADMAEHDPGLPDDDQLLLADAALPEPEGVGG